MESTAPKLQTKKWKNSKILISIVFWVVTVGGAILYTDWNNRKALEIQQAEIQQVLDIERGVTCPALLSIARTPRDTLIVMKNKPICVEYVFENMDQ